MTKVKIEKVLEVEPKKYLIFFTVNKYIFEKGKIGVGFEILIKAIVLIKKEFEDLQSSKVYFKKAYGILLKEKNRFNKKEYNRLYNIISESSDD